MTTEIETTHPVVMDLDTGSPLDGECSPGLAEASAAANETGAVPAYLDGSGVWQYVQPSMVDQYRRTRGLAIRSVYVEQM